MNQHDTTSSAALLIVEAYLRFVIGEKLAVDPLSIDAKEALFSLGVSSLVGEEIRAELGQHFDGLSSTVLFEQPSVLRLSRHLAPRMARPIDPAPLAHILGRLEAPAAEAATAAPAAPSPASDEAAPAAGSGEHANAIAVIGLSGRFPKARNARQFWRNLVANLDCVGEIPAERWDAMALQDEARPDGGHPRWGGFIDGVEQFDPLFFRISHKEAEQLDPQQKLFLQCAWELMEDAGYGDVEHRPTDQIGVYVGVTWNEFSLVARDEGAAQGGGSLYWGIPNRVSYFLDLKGPSQAIDTACSSSLVAIHNACQSLLSGECEMAIAGGVNLNLHPAKYRFLARNHFLSAEGKCRSFGEGGSGYVPGEGVAAVLLKPLAKAIEDRDFIYGVIRGSATNHGGKVTGYTVPNPTAHGELVVSAMHHARVRPSEVDYIECHGTGTELGDPIEIRGLANAFGDEAARQACLVGSVKSNIGHLEAAAGAAGLIKLLMAMQHRLLPASLHAEQENHRIAFADSPFALLKHNTEWQPREGRATRIAGLSSFGAGGTNAHLVLESFAMPQPPAHANPGPHWIALSAQSAQQLQAHAAALADFIDELGNAPQPLYTLANMAHTLGTGRTHFAARLLVRADSLGELLQKLRRFDGHSQVQAGLHAGMAKLNTATAVRTLPLDAEDAERAAAWVNGELAAYPFASPAAAHKLPLPTYPFLRERSWPSNRLPLVIDAGSQAAAPALHPLLDANVSTLRKQEFRKTLRKADYYLRDHLVALEHVVPGVCHLEIATAAARLALESDSVTLQDVWFTNVIAVKDATRELRIVLSPRDAQVEYAISAVDDDTPFSRGRIVHRALAVAGPAAVDLAAVRTRLQAEWDVAEVYRRFQAIGVIQKQTFQVLHRLQFGAGTAGAEALAHLKLDASLQGDFAQHSLHPTLMDGAVQTAMMLLQFALGRPLAILPIHFGSVSRLRAMTPEVFVHCRLKHLDAKRFDLTLCDADGQPLVEITDFILKEMKDGKPSAGARTQAAAAQAVVADAWLSYYLPVPVPRPAAEASGSLPALLVCGGNGDALQALARSSAFAGTRLVHARWDCAFADDGGERYTVDPAQPQHFVQLAERLATAGVPQHVLFLTDRDDRDDGGDPAAAMQRGGRAVFLLCKALMTRTKALSIACHWDGRRAADGALSGFFRTLAVEKPSFRGRLVDTGTATLDDGTLLRLKQELLQPAGADTEVRSTAEGRHVLSFRRVAAAERPADAPSRFKAHGVYLVSGGMGAIGLIVARHLLQTCGATVYLLGRSALDAARQATLDALSALGGSARYVACDIASRDSVAAAIAQIVAEAGRLDGVLHSAGVIEDDFILKKSPDAFDRVLAPKVLGTTHLDDATRALPLDLFVVFSSVTAILGNLGQCDYALGNAFADHFCAERQARVARGERSGQSLAINWPYWQEGGMTLTEREQAALRKGFGFAPLSTADGLRALEDCLSLGVPQAAVMQGDTARIHQVLGIAEAGSEFSPANTAQAAAAAGPATATAATDLPKRVERYLKDLLSEKLKIPPLRLDAQQTFDHFGLDSIAMIELIGAMEGRFVDLPKTLFFEHQSIADLVTYFVDHHPGSFAAAEAPVPATASAPAAPRAAVQDSGFRSFLEPLQPLTLKAPLSDEPIAIIGLAGRYPMADDLDAFWRNLTEARHCVQEIPPERWSVDDHFQPANALKATGDGKSYGRWGSFLRDVDKFDPIYFNITPKEAELLDPQERVFLECVTSAIEDAGYRADQLDYRKVGKTNRVGVYVGNMWGDYQLYSSHDGARVSQTPQSFYWSLANRVSYFFNFAGPSFTVDSACSSSFIALKLACDSLRSGETSVAVAGAVNLSLHPQKYALLSRMKFLSSDGLCRTFGEGGNGYVPGEGAGAVVLKPLSQALRDRDHIHGVIRAGVLNHGGRAAGFTVPSPVAQGNLVREALSKADLAPGEIDYLEAHGTGTDLGDPVEIAGLTRAFAGAPLQSCPIGSVKSNYGHLEAAAGMIALTKVLMQFKHRTLVPSIHSQHLNPKIKFEETPFRVQQTCAPWPARVVGEPGAQRELPRIAGISSFGAGGTNAHFIVEEPPQRLQAAEDGSPQLVTFSAKTRERLRALLQRHADFLAKRVDDAADQPLADIGYTLNTGRTPLDTRVALVAHSRDQLRAMVQRLAAGEAEVPGAVWGDSPQARSAAELATEREAVNRWIDARDLPQLALAWAGGGELDWARLYDGQARNRLPLPTYPFARERYWIDESAARVSPRSAQPQLHVWLDENISTLAQQMFSKTFHADDRWLAHHRVNGHRMLPGVVHLEMARAAIALSCQQPLQRIDDVAWLVPVVIDEGHKTLTLRLIPHGDGGWFEVSSVAGGEPVVHAHGRFVLGPVQGDAIDAEEQVDLDALRRRCTLVVDTAAQYERLGALGLAYGPSFRETREAWANPHEALVRLEADSDGLPGEGIHPALLDGALRAALLIDGAPLPFAQVPVGLASAVLAAGVGPRCWAHARRRQAEDGGLHDITLLDDSGRVLGRLDGLAIRPLLLAPAKRAALATAPVAAHQAAPVASAGAADATAVIGFLKQAIAQVTKLPLERIGADSAFADIGIDSLMILDLNELLESHLGKLSKTLFYEYPNTRELAAHLWDDHAERLKPVLAGQAAPATPAASKEPAHPAATDEPAEAPAAPPAPKPALPYAALLQGRAAPASDGVEPIAVIGYAGMFPQAEDADAFWDNLKAGRDCIEEVPPTRWDHSKLYVPGTSQPGLASAKWGGFLPNVDSFDAQFFQMPPVMAKQIDPQERLFLQVAWSAMESAGYTPAGMADGPAKSRDCGVFVGFMWSHYGLIENDEHRKGNPAVSLAWNSSIANRVSHFCDFKGPSYVVDVACASSLLSVHLACESLRRGECRYAIAGGVNVTIHPAKHKGLTQMGMLAADGRCRSFGEGGSGYVPGEGVGAVLLKPLAQAQRDGDTIYMVILGSAVNHGGRSNGYTVPSPDAQAKVIGQALKTAQVPARDIGYVETHGTGTALGDPIEVTGLTKCFRTQTQDRQFCAIGSVKSNIGHLESAAGIASFIKVLLQLQHQQLVPSLHSQRLNPHIDFEATPFHVQQTLQPWTRHAVERTALVNSFAAGGTNASIVVREYAMPAMPAGDNDAGSDSGEALIVLSARRDPNLRAIARRLHDHLSRETVPLHDLAYTLQTGREAMAHRVAFRVSSIDALRRKLATFASGANCDNEGKEGDVNGVCTPIPPAQLSIAQREDVQALLRARDLGALARKWIAGHPVAWESLHLGATRRRLRLPTYPFTQERHWLHIQGASGVLCAPDAGLARPALHPLLDENRSSFDGLLFTKAFTPQDALLRDRQQQGRALLPEAAFLEMARAAGTLAAGREVVALRQVTWRRPFAAADGGPTLQLRLQQQGGLARFDCVSGDAPRATVHAQGELVFGDRCEATEQLDVEAAQARCTEALDGAQFHALLAAQGLQLSGSACIVESLRRGEREALARVVPATPEDGVMLEPAVIDAALHCAIALLGDQADGTRGHALLSVARVHLFQRTAGPCVVHLSRLDDGRSALKHFDVLVCDAQGALLVALNDVCLQPGSPDDRPAGEPAAHDRIATNLGRAPVSQAHAPRPALLFARHEADDGPLPIAIVGLGLSDGEPTAFDPQFFGMTAQQAAALGAADRLYLEAAALALEDAGHSRERLQGLRIAVVAGLDEAAAAHASAQTPADTAAAWLGAQAAALSLQAGAAPSVMAIHLACRQLQAGDCDIAIAGGVVLAQGAGAVLLKALPQARADGDRVLGVVRASGQALADVADLDREPLLAQAGWNAATADHLALPGMAGSSHGITALAEVLGRHDGRWRSPARRTVISRADARGHTLCLLVETLPPPAQPASGLLQRRVFVFSAAEAQRLQSAVGAIAALLRERGAGADAAFLRDLAYTLQVGRTAQAQRLAFITADAGELLAQLDRFAQSEGRETAGIHGTAQAAGGMPPGVFDGALGDELFERIVARGELKALAQLWVSGVDLPWELLYTDGGAAPAWRERPQRLSLPASPQRKQFMAIANASGPARGLALHGHVVALHPMVDSNSFTLWRYAYSKRFSGHEFFLADHRVQERVVLPGVAYLEMARFAGQAASPVDHVAHLTNVMWTAPMVVDRPLDVTIELLPKDEHVVFEISSAPTTEQHIVHAIGELHYSDEPPLGRRVALDAIRARLPHCKQQAELYAFFRKMGFGYGPSYVSTQRLWFGADEALSELRLPTALIDTLGVLALHPSLMDAALRTALGLDPRFLDGEAELVLPFALGRLTHYKPLPPVCFAHVTRQGSANADFAKYHIHLLDAEGQLLVEMNDFSARRLSAKASVPGYYQMRWDDVPPPRAGSLDGDTVLVLTDDAELVEALRQAPLPQGQQLVWVRAGAAFTAVTPVHYEIDPAQPADVHALLAALAARGHRPGTIVHAFGCGLSASPWDTPDLAERLRRLEADTGRGLQALLWLLQAFSAALPQQLVRCLYCHVDHVGDAAGVAPQHEMVAAFGRSLTAAAPQFRLATLGLDSAAAQSALAGTIAAELCASAFAAGGETRYVAAQRQVHRVQPYAHPGRAAPLAVRPEATVLVTGGLGKLGRLFCRYLAQQARARIAITGRSALTPEGRAFMDLLRAEGAQDVCYLAADSTNASAMQDVVEAVVKRMGALHGVLHCAGVAGQTPAADVSKTDFDRVLDVKVKGTLVLDETTRGQPLEFFVLFSSLSSLVGDFGSGSYAAGNRFLDGFAQLREQWRAAGERAGRTLAMGWPLWDAGGMQIPEEERALYFGYSGMQALCEDDGIAAFEQMMGYGQPRLAFVRGDEEKIHRVLQIEARDKAPAQRTAPVTPPTPLAPPAPLAPPSRPAAAADDPAAFADAVVAYVKRHLSATLELAAEHLQPEQPFEAYGMDSVLIMKMTQRLKDDLGEIPKTALFEYNTLRDLAGYLQQRHAVQLQALLGPQPGAGGGLLARELEAPYRTDAAEAAKADSLPAPFAPDTPPSSAAAPAIDLLQLAATPSTRPATQAIGRWSHKANLSLPAQSPAGEPAAAGPARPSTISEGIAIVGLAGRYPQSPTLDDFWRHAVDGHVVTGEIPPERWDAMAYFAASDRPVPGRSRSRWGGFLEDAERFDAAFFGLSPQEAGKLDPQVRLMLQTVWHTVEDAGYTPESLRQRLVGVYLGVQYGDFSWLSAETYLKTGHYAGPGCVHSELANHVSYFMDFRGPSLTVETGCSSALTALHLARSAILQGECDAAIAGGVNLSLHHGKYLMLDGLKVLSLQGVERTFDEQADGYVPSEGVGAVMLKRLSQAVADGDHVYGVISGSAINHSGTGAGQYLPNLKMLESTVDKALQQAGLQASALQYIECHGTGTELGDPIELKALSNRLLAGGAARASCALGTKANFGHLEAASGICSLTKVLLGLRHRRIAPCANLDRVNESLDPASSPFEFPSQAREWPAVAGRRFAAVNSFGLGGSNAFIVVASHDAAQQPPSTDAPQLFVLSAQTRDSLDAMAQALCHFALKQLDLEEPAHLADAAFTLQTGRQPMAERLALVAGSWQELAQQLQAAARGQDASDHADSGVVRGTVKPQRGGRVATAPAAHEPRAAAAAWCAGHAVDSLALHAGRSPRRMSMPLYAFARTPCHLQGRSAGQIQALAGGPAVADPAPKAAAFPATVHEASAFVLPDALRGTWFAGAPDAAPAAISKRRKYWKQRLVDLAAMPALDAAPASGVSGTGSHPIGLPPPLLGGLQQLSHRFQIEPRTLLWGAWAIVLERYTGARSVQALVAHGTGVCLSGLTLGGRGTATDWLVSTQHTLREDLRHAAASTAELAPLLPAGVLQASMRTLLAFGTDAQRLITKANAPITLSADLDAPDLGLMLRHDRARAGDEFIERMVCHLVVVLEALAEHPQRNPAAISLQTQQERREKFWAQVDRLDMPLN